MKTLWGRLRRAWRDWKTGTLECYGGPLDGDRRQWKDARYRWCFVEWARRGGIVEGRYTRRANRWVWEQYAPVRAPKNHSLDTPDWL